MADKRHPSDAGFVGHGGPGPARGAHFPGPPGFHIPGQPIADPNHMEQFTIKHDHKHHPQEVKHLNQYTGYFTTPDGDFPVSVVADSIKEAAKILTMPGVFGEDIEEPTTIKFIKGKIAVTIPVRMTGFNVVIVPADAINSGAYATPAHAEVKNGTEVIFTAYEPWGWEFDGWYKGDQCLSKELVTAIEVYDAYSSLIEYQARYNFVPELRNGRFLELGTGWHMDLFIGQWGGEYQGRVILFSYDNPDYHFVIREITQDGDDTILNLNADLSVTQTPEDVGMTLRCTPTPIGFNVVVSGISQNNPWDISEERQLSLKWVGDHSKTYLSFTRKIK